MLSGTKPLKVNPDIEAEWNTKGKVVMNGSSRIRSRIKHLITAVTPISINNQAVSMCIFMMPFCNVWICWFLSLRFSCFESSDGCHSNSWILLTPCMINRPQLWKNKCSCSEITKQIFKSLTLFKSFRKHNVVLPCK